MTTIAACLTYPNGTPIDGLLCKIDKVWAPPTPVNGKFGPTSVQNISLSDVAGNKIRCSVWGHHDLTANQGQDVALQSKNGKGIKVVHKPYTDKNGAQNPGIGLEISKDIVFQIPSVVGLKAPQAPVGQPVTAPQTAIPSNPSPSGAIRGEKVGMALNNACNSLSAEGIEITKETLWKRASLIITVGNQLEAGNLFGSAVPVVAAPPAQLAPPMPVLPADPADSEYAEQDGDAPF